MVPAVEFCTNVSLGKQSFRDISHFSSEKKFFCRLLDSII
jgi:hypothetical protein